MRLQLISVLICLVFSIGATARAENRELCRITKGPPGPSDSRTARIEFPDGREIIILGHNHGDRSVPFRLNRIIKSELSNEQAAAELALIHSEIQLALIHAREDREYLKNLLRNPRFTFVGLEMSPEVATVNAESYVLLHRDFLKSARARSLDEGQSQDAALVAVGAVTQLKLQQPELFFNRELIGFESATSIRAYNEAAAAAENAHAALREAGQSDARFWSDIGGTDLQLWNVYPTYTAALEEKYFESIASAPIPPQYRDLTLVWARARLREMATLKDREESAAENLLRTRRSGVVLIGAAHLPSLANTLREKCLLVPASMSLVELRE